MHANKLFWIEQIKDINDWNIWYKWKINECSNKWNLHDWNLNG